MIGIEILMTFVLVFVVLATTDHNRRDGGSISIIAGLTVAGLHLAGVGTASISYHNINMSLLITLNTEMYCINKGYC